MSFTPSEVLSRTAAEPEELPEIKFAEVWKSYTSRNGRTDALSEINLKIFPGEFICLIGESGCGKSTLLHMIAGFEMPTRGQVLVGGEPVMGPSYRRGVVFQESSLLPWLTVQQNISLGPDIRGQLADSAADVRELIGLVGLSGFEKSYPAQLSGGMAQRAAIARALVNRPDVLLCDEPFGALDAFTRMKLQNELVRIWERQHCTMVFVTHDIDEAVYLASRVVVLTPRPGKISGIFNVSLRRPRDRTSSEFIRLRGMIAKEFLTLRNTD